MCTQGSIETASDRFSEKYLFFLGIFRNFLELILNGAAMIGCSREYYNWKLYFKYKSKSKTESVKAPS